MEEANERAFIFVSCHTVHHTIAGIHVAAKYPVDTFIRFLHALSKNSVVAFALNATPATQHAPGKVGASGSACVCVCVCVRARM